MDWDGDVREADVGHFIVTKAIMIDELSDAPTVYIPCIGTYRVTQKTPAS